jgi:hypothetical protein
MEPFSDDFRDLIIALSDAEARFMVVGGYAVAAHGRPRGTKDLDVWVEPTLENAHRVLTALAEFGAAAGDLTPEELATPGTGFMMGRPPTRIDILTRLVAVDFDTAWSRAPITEFAPECSCRVIGLDDLIANKRAAGRPQDLADVQALERLRQRRPKKR